MLYTLFENFLNAIIYTFGCTFGAFVPVFILMRVHFYVRKKAYQKRKQRITMAQKAYKELVAISNEAIQRAYKSAGVKNFQELLNDPEGLEHLDKLQYVRLVNYVNEKLDVKIKNLDKLNKLAIDMMYIENYNFKTYLSAILDKRFPEKKY